MSVEDRAKRIFGKQCRFLTGDEVVCVAHKYYNYNPCDVCCYQDGRESMYIPKTRLACPLCGSTREPGEVLCQDCQLTALLEACRWFRKS